MEYFFKYYTNVKLRWLGKPIVEVLQSEFIEKDVNYYEEAISKGVVQVNDCNVDKNYLLKSNDKITHLIHLHEPESPEIQIIARTDNYVVVNKPYGMVCHPVGSYNNFSVTKTLFGDKPVGCVYRLDLPVSGVLIITTDNRGNMHKLLDRATKFYVARVKGDFPDKIVVDEPILHNKENKISVIDPEGKPSKTIFEKIKFCDGFSLVKCQPVTGRTHQIRIHISSIGFPIVNDFIYNPEVEKPVIEKKPFGCNADISMYKEYEKYKFAVDKCQKENTRMFLFKDKFLCLHAWKYFFDGKVFEAPLPEWANI